MTLAKEVKIDNTSVLAKVKQLEQRVTFLEELLASVRKYCKVCDASINTKNTSKEGMLAELCDQCWQTQNTDLP